MIDYYPCKPDLNYMMYFGSFLLHLHVRYKSGFVLVSKEVCSCKSKYVVCDILWKVCWGAVIGKAQKNFSNVACLDGNE